MKVSKFLAVGMLLVGVFCLFVFSKLRLKNGVIVCPIVTTWCCVHRERIWIPIQNICFSVKVRRGEKKLQNFEATEILYKMNVSVCFNWQTVSCL